MNRSFLLCLFILCTNILNAQQPDKAEGEAIFKNRCAACHKVNADFAGPALRDVWDRHDMAWIVQFVHSSQTVIKSGDKAAGELFEKYGHLVMPDHPDISESNIAAILEYVKAESKVPEAKKPFVTPHEEHPAYTPLTLHDTNFFAVYISLVILLVVALLLAVRAKEYERNK